MKILFFILPLLTFLSGNECEFQSNTDDFKQINSNGITFKWRSENGHIKCQVIAPTPGWVSVGFKNSRGLIQSNQIMGCFRDGQSFCEDRYVVSLREKPLIEDLGGSSAIVQFEVIENNGVAELYFTIPSRTYDGYHYDLSQGERVYVSLGFSGSDDFEQRPKRQFETIITI